MEPVQALAILSLGAFVAVLVSAAFYVFTVRPRLLEPVSLSAMGLLDESLQDELNQQRVMVEELNTSLAHHTALIQAQASDLEVDEGAEVLRAVLDSQRETAGRLTALLTAQASQIQGLDTRLSHQEQTLTALTGETLPGVVAQINQQGETLQHLDQRIAARDPALAESVKAQADQLVALSARLDEWVAVHTPANEQLAEHARILAELDRELAAQAQTTQQVDAKVDQHTGLLNTILQQLAQAIPIINRLATSPPRPDQDRLTDIKGIGPVYAGKLYEAGIQKYRQLAAMTPEEIYTLISEPKWRMRSIDPESWIEQAKHLASQREKVETIS